MFQNLKYRFYSLSEIENLEILKTFNCSIVPDIENFLQNKAIEFEKRDVSRTYLLIDTINLKIVAYFTLSISVSTTNKLSKTQIKKIDGFSKFRECLGFYLIGQLGIDDNYRKLHKKQGLGKILLKYIKIILKQSQDLVGGRFILIDAVKDKKVIEFYENNHFYKLYEDDESIKMIMEL